ncbi:MAG: NUDIX domain-containing protein [Candidatus Taylorbacteria bacterium]|nr:NUDIX domain-containing protein [Candidatus Taylorbacteria bacterium]
MSHEERPKVGIGVMIIKDNKVLLGKRKGSHGEGEYAWPGGHMEYMESFQDCAKRETLEETGIQIHNVRFLRLMNLKTYAPKHYVDIGLIADWKSGEPEIMEPEKIEEWNWYDINELPEPLFSSIPSYIEAYKTGKNYWDA